jgi:hypothetical protein
MICKRDCNFSVKDKTASPHHTYAKRSVALCGSAVALCVCMVESFSLRVFLTRAVFIKL